MKGHGDRGEPDGDLGAGGWSLGTPRERGTGTRAAGMRRRRTGEPGALGLQGPGIQALGARCAGTPGDRERGDSGGLGPLGVRGGA